MFKKRQKREVIEDVIRCLSKSILENRRLISKQHGKILSLKQRVWELECHPMEETIDQIKADVTEWQAAGERFSKRTNDCEKTEVKDANA